jgi:hypothetical protein
VDIEHGGDAGFTAQALDIVNASGMGSDKEARKDLRVGEFFAGESTHFLLRLQVSTKFGGPLTFADEGVYDVETLRSVLSLLIDTQKALELN